MKTENLSDDIVTLDMLNVIGDAFNQNNINAVMNCFDKKAIFDHAAGQDIHGTRYEGHEALRKVFETLFNNVQSVHWETIDQRINGNKAFCEYRRKAILKNGEVQDFHSIDILTFKKGLIIHKNTYYKNIVVP